MTMFIDMPLTCEVRQRLQEQGKIIVWKELDFFSALDPTTYSLRSRGGEFEWRAGWNEAKRNIWRRPGAVYHGKEIGKGVLHTYLHKRINMVPLVGHANDFYAAGFQAHYGYYTHIFTYDDLTRPHATFRRLWLDQAVYDRATKGSRDFDDLLC